MKTSGSSIALTSACNFCAFFVGMFLPLPDAARFSITAAIAVLVNFLVTVLGVSAILSIDSKRQNRNEADPFCMCMKSTGNMFFS